ncbi:type II secretion system protein GspL [Scandinavium sp. H11S7]|uniref:Type II secretion system protein L n=1 Tax=Scandinavium hiltneri TaxID=2926519 RepID=A0ABT2E5Z9_9ENTR|nr:type II secretion system protein GspL [Scandinavium hiltneri]MCS2158436.1 type II secretion system protein GspL [Scandinavium hiltneri]MCS2163306.1 type II secretion system protein GspL [Scandinavium hiltneri]
MKQVLFIRPDSLRDEKIWWCESGSSQIDTLAGESELHKLSTHALASRVCLLLPASDMVFRHFSLPKKTLGAQSIPFSWLAEETLIGDVDTLHWTVLRKKGSEVDAVAVVADRLQFWLDQCQQAGLTVIQALPDAILLPETTAGCTAVALEENYWLRFSSFSACNSDAALLPWLLQQNAEQRICAYGVMPEGVTVSESHDWQHPLQLIQPQWKQCNANLLHGAFDFRAEKGGTKGWRWWLAGAVALVCGSLLLPRAFTAWLLIQQENHLQEEIVQLYQHHFPRLKHQSNLKYYFGQNVKKEKKDVFMQLDDLDNLKQTVSGLRVNSLEYNAEGGRITLLVQAQQQQTLQEFVDKSREKFTFTLQPVSVKAPWTALITGTVK